MCEIKVYKTDVQTHTIARYLTQSIYQEFPHSDVSFDLEDCDNVLRIESLNGKVNEKRLRKIFENNGYHLESLLI